MKIYKITEASQYMGVSINTLKTLSNNGVEFNKEVKMLKNCAICTKYEQFDMFMMFLDKKEVDGVMIWTEIKPSEESRRIREDEPLEEFLICAECFKKEVR